MDQVMSETEKAAEKKKSECLEFLRKRNERRLQPCYYHFLPHFARCLEKFFLFWSSGGCYEEGYLIFWKISGTADGKENMAAHQTSTPCFSTYLYIQIYYYIFAFFPIHSHVFLISIPQCVPNPNIINFSAYMRRNVSTSSSSFFSFPLFFQPCVFPFFHRFHTKKYSPFWKTQKSERKKGCYFSSFFFGRGADVVWVSRCINLSTYCDL